MLYRTLMVLPLLALFVGCSPDPSPGAIKVGWRLGFGVDCSDAEADIDTISITILEPGGEGAPEVSSQTFPCSAGQATIDRLPIGTYNLLLEGGNGDRFDYPTFKATVPTVIVEEGAIIDVGEVALEKVPPSENPGKLRIEWDFESGLCPANNVETVQLVVWRDRVYRQHDDNYDCNMGGVELELAPGMYAIVLEGLDIEGMVTRRASREDIEIVQGQTTELKGSEALVLEVF